MSMFALSVWAALLVPCLQAAGPPACRLGNAPGGDLPLFNPAPLPAWTTAGANATEACCAALCAKTKSCVAYVYEGPSLCPSTPPNCWLKKEFTHMRKLSCACTGFNGQ